MFFQKWKSPPVLKRMCVKSLCVCVCVRVKRDGMTTGVKLPSTFIFILIRHGCCIRSILQKVFCFFGSLLVTLFACSLYRREVREVAGRDGYTHAKKSSHDYCSYCSFAAACVYFPSPSLPSGLSNVEHISTLRRFMRV